MQALTDTFNSLFNWLTSPTAGFIVQELIAIGAARMALIQLQEKFRKQAEVHKKEGHQIKNVIYLACIFALVFNFITYWSGLRSAKTQDDIINQQKRSITALRKQLDTATKAVKGKLAESEGHLATQAAKNALKAAEQLNSTADSLKMIIKGSDDCPYIAVASGVSDFILIFHNLTNHPMYSLLYKIYFYDGLEQCDIKKDIDGIWKFNPDCYKKNTIENIPAIQIIRPRNAFTVPLVLKNLERGKLEVMIVIGDKGYIEDIIYEKVNTSYKYRAMVYRFNVSDYTDKSSTFIKEWGDQFEGSMKDLFKLPKNFGISNN